MPLATPTPTCRSSGRDSPLTLRKKPGRARSRPRELSPGRDRCRCDPARPTRLEQLTSMPNADGLFMMAADAALLEAGERVSVQVLTPGLPGQARPGTCGRSGCRIGRRTVIPNGSRQGPHRHRWPSSPATALPASSPQQDARGRLPRGPPEHAQWSGLARNCRPWHRLPSSRRCGGGAVEIPRWSRTRCAVRPREPIGCAHHRSPPTTAVPAWPPLAADSSLTREDPGSYATKASVLATEGAPAMGSAATSRRDENPPPPL